MSEKIKVISLIPEPILQFFEYAHLSPELQSVVIPFRDLAHAMVKQDTVVLSDDTFPLPRNLERTVALRKLLEAKDAAVRAYLYKED